MPDEETVVLNVTLSWSYATQEYQEAYDTRIALSDWNKMTDQERRTMRNIAYDYVVSNQENGGVEVLTKGAKAW